MIYSEEKKFVFIHIPKTAGTSITAAIAPFSLYKHEKMKTTGKGFQVPYHVPIRLVSKIHSGIRDKHLIRGRINFTYFKFSVVRNPWDRMRSLWHIYGQYKPKRLKKPEIPFKEFIFSLHKIKNDNVHRKINLPCSWWLTEKDGESLRVDFVAKFENIEEDWKYICKRIGIDVPLPHQNTRDWKTEGPTTYRKYYDSESRDKIARIFHEDIHRWGYEF